MMMKMMTHLGQSASQYRSFSVVFWWNTTSLLRFLFCPLKLVRLTGTSREEWQSDILGNDSRAQDYITSWCCIKHRIWWSRSNQHAFITCDHHSPLTLSLKLPCKPLNMSHKYEPRFASSFVTLVMFALHFHSKYNNVTHVTYHTRRNPPYSSRVDSVSNHPISSHFHN